MDDYSQSVPLPQSDPHTNADKTESSWPEGYWKVFGSLADDETFTLPEDMPINRILD